jgi:hypothetical protein
MNAGYNESITTVICLFDASPLWVTRTKQPLPQTPFVSEANNETVHGWLA